MKVIAIVPGTAGSRLVERPGPSITVPDEIKLRVIRSGICGTNREEMSAQAHRHWSGHVQGLITDRHPADRFAESVDHHQPNTIKEVIEWGAAAQHA
jgi:hypothetical protein